MTICFVHNWPPNLYLFNLDSVTEMVDIDYNMLVELHAVTLITQPISQTTPTKVLRQHTCNKRGVDNNKRGVDNNKRCVDNNKGV